MATRRAVANGNWSNTATWNGGVVPTDGDTVYANGFNVTINQDILIGGANNPTVNAGSFVSGQWYEVLFVGSTNFTGIGAASNTAGTIFLATGAGTGTGNARALATLTTATNTAAGATGGGGQFAMSSAYNMTCDLRAAATVCLNVTGATNMTLSGLRIVGGATLGGHGLNYAGTGTVTVSGSALTGGSSNGASINNASTGTISVSDSTLTSGQAGVAHAIGNSSTGNVSISNSTIAATSTSAVTINNALTGSITLSNSNISGGNTNAHGISNVTTGSIAASGCTFLGGNTGFAIFNPSSGTVICTTSTFTASAFTNAVSSSSTSADVRLSGDFLDHWSGWKAVNSPRFRLGTSPTLGQTRYALAGTTDSYFSMYGADNGSFGNPIAANVRSGVSYGGGNITGSCAVPAAGSVALGVPVDGTTGTAVLTPEAVWGHASRSITGGTVTTLTNAPASVTPNDIWSHATRTLTTSSGPTAVEIRQEIDANSTKLDAAISSRLAGSAYTAPTTPPTAAQIATAVEGSLLNEADGQAVLNAIVGAIGNTNLSEVSLVAAVRADLERVGGKIDSIPAAPTAAANATAVWATASKTITGGTVDTLTNSPSVPSAASIAAATRSELAVELARVDASVSSRLAGSAYTAPANSDVAAIKVKTDALVVERLNNCATTAIVGNLIAQANS